MKLVRLGTIVRTHGVNGAFVVNSDAGKESALGSLKEILIKNNRHTIQEAAWMPSGWKVLVEGVETHEAAQALRGTELFADREELPKLSESEFYLDDLEGCTAIDETTHQVIGKFVGIESYGGNDLWRFELLGKSVLVTPSKRFIVRVESKKSIYLKNVSELKPQ